VTLARRAARGEAWYTEHRSHAYQRLARSGWGHARVAAAVLLVNLLLGIAAWAGTTRPPLLLPAAAAALLLLAVLYLRIEAAHPFPQTTSTHEAVS
jgi:Fuc2NAc and GlcNAc transferase